MTLTSEVPFHADDLAAGRRQPVRIACGKTMRRNVRPGREPERPRGIVLARRPPTGCPGALDLGHVGGLVQRQPEHRNDEGRDQVIGVPADPAAQAEGDPMVAAPGRPGCTKQQLDQHRRAAEEPNV